MSHKHWNYETITQKPRQTITIKQKCFLCCTTFPKLKLTHELDSNTCSEGVRCLQKVRRLCRADEHVWLFTGQIRFFSFLGPHSQESSIEKRLRIYLAYTKSNLTATSANKYYKSYVRQTRNKFQLAAATQTQTNWGWGRRPVLFWKWT